MPEQLYGYFSQECFDKCGGFVYAQDGAEFVVTNVSPMPNLANDADNDVGWANTFCVGPVSDLVKKLPIGSVYIDSIGLWTSHGKKSLVDMDYDEDYRDSWDYEQAQIERYRNNRIQDYDEGVLNFEPSYKAIHYNDIELDNAMREGLNKPISPRRKRGHTCGRKKIREFRAGEYARLAMRLPAIDREPEIPVGAIVKIVKVVAYVPDEIPEYDYDDGFGNQCIRDSVGHTQQVKIKTRRHTIERLSAAYLSKL